MIYIKENDEYSKYYTSYDNRLICAHADNTETAVVGGVSGEFDALCDNRKCVHFILQGTGGELIYLIKEKEIWRKFNLLKSRNGVKKISNIRLCMQGKYLCAFYIMNHNGKKIIVKHRFCNDNLYEEPQVLGATTLKGNYCICRTGGEFILIYKNENSNWIKCNISEEFSKCESQIINFEKDVINLKSIVVNGILYACAIVAKNNSAIMEFFDTNNASQSKIISFGLSRNCVPELIYKGGHLHIQWEENSSIIEVCADITQLNFSKPMRTQTQCSLAGLRLPDDENTVVSDKCAIHNFSPCLRKYKKQHTNSFEGRTASTMKPDLHRPEFYNEDNSILLEKLKSIENDIDNMGKRLLEICSYLEVLKIHGEMAHNDNFEASIQSKNDNIALGDIGEIDTDNMKLFENTDIDSVLPETKPQEVI